MSDCNCGAIIGDFERHWERIAHEWEKIEQQRVNLANERRELNRLKAKLKRQEQELERLQAATNRGRLDVIKRITTGGIPFVRRWYVYALVDPRDGLIHYVGVGRNPEARYVSHLKGERSGGPVKEAWIRELKAARLQPDLIILEEIVGGREQGDDPYQAEGMWIYACLEAGMPLTNREAGGYGKEA